MLSSPLALIPAQRWSNGEEAGKLATSAISGSRTPSMLTDSRVDKRFWG